MDEDPHDGDASVLRFSGAGNKEVFTVADQLCDSDLVTSVKVRWVAKRGSGNDWQARAGLVLGGDEYYGPTVNLTADYVLREESFVNNPATGQPWTVAEVRAAKLIYQQVAITLQIPRAMLTEIVLVVTVTRCYEPTDTFPQTPPPQWSQACFPFHPAHPSTTHFNYLDHERAGTADGQWQCIQEAGS